MWSVITGVLVAFGAFIIISAILGAVLAATGVAEGGLKPDEVKNVGLGAAIGLGLTQLLSYLWGGYTAGRMSRGSGVLNGVLVPVVALVLMVLLGGALALVGGAQTNAKPSDVQNLPLALGRFADIATGVGIALLVLMLIGGALGGWLGEKWHSKLEEHELNQGR